MKTKKKRQEHGLLSRPKSSGQGGNAIMKLGFAIDATGSEEYPYLELLLLADAVALRELSELLSDLADKAERMEDDPDYHVHLGKPQAPFDVRLSDRVELRIELLPNGPKRKVLKRLNVSRDTVRNGSMIPHLRELIKVASRKIS